MSENSNKILSEEAETKIYFIWTLEETVYNDTTEYKSTYSFLLHTEQTNACVYILGPLCG